MIVIVNSVLSVHLFQENKSYGIINHLHLSSDVQEVASGTVTVGIGVHNVLLPWE
jgi:hypothetical protein